MPTITVAQVRKAVAGTIAMLAQLVAFGVLDGTNLKVAQAVIVAGGAAGIYAAKNEPQR